MLNFDNFDILVFLIFFVITFCSILVISSTNKVFVLLFLTLSFIFPFVLLIMFECKFLALLIIVIFIGAVSVLFLFLIMMVDTKIMKMIGGVKFLDNKRHIISSLFLFFFYIIFNSFLFCTEFNFLNNLDYILGVVIVNERNHLHVTDKMSLGEESSLITNSKFILHPLSGKLCQHFGIGISAALKDLNIVSLSDNSPKYLDLDILLKLDSFGENSKLINKHQQFTNLFDLNTPKINTCIIQINPNNKTLYNCVNPNDFSLKFQNKIKSDKSNAKFNQCNVSHFRHNRINHIIGYQTAYFNKMLILNAEINLKKDLETNYLSLELWFAIKDALTKFSILEGGFKVKVKTSTDLIGRIFVIREPQNLLNLTTL